MTSKLYELLTRSSEPETIESEIYGTLIDAVKEKLIATNFIALRIGKESIPGDSIKIDYVDKDVMVVHEVAEGAFSLSADLRRMCVGL